MKNEDYCAIIRSGLQRIIGEVSMDGGANLHALNIHAESFFRDFLNLLFGWELRNANADDPNAAGIDLRYPGGNVVVQVSSTYTKEKIQHSLAESEAYKGSHFYFAAISNDKHSFTFTESEKHGLIFNPEKDILTPKRLHSIIVTDCDLERQRELAALTARYLDGLEKRKRLKPLGSRSTRTGFEYNFEVAGRPVVPFVGRGAEMEALLNFARGEDDVFRWWAVTAPGGAGKSRLAYELQRELLRLGGWDVRAVPGSVIRSESELLGLADAFPGRTLFIVDYVQQYTEELCKWFLTLADPDSERTAPLRVLLLERDVRDAEGSYPWLDRLFGVDTRVEAAFFAEDGRPMELNPLAPEAEGAEDPLLRVIRSFADSVCAQGIAKGDDSLTRLPEGKEGELRTKLDRLDPQLVRPLFAMILADAWVRDPEALRWTQDKLLKETVLREQNFLTKRLEPYGGAQNPKLPRAALQVLAVATVVGAGDGTLQSSELSELNCGKVLAAFAELNRKALTGKGEDLTEALLAEAGLWAEGELIPLRPDLLGEFYVLEHMKKLRPQEASDFFSAILSAPAAALTFFLRVLRDYPGTVELPGAQGYRDWFLPAGLELEEERAAWLVWLLRKLFEGAPLPPGSGTDQGGHYGAKTYSARAWLADRIAGYAAAMPESSVEAAHVFHNLADTLRRSGDFPKALEFFQKALAISEKLLGPEHPDTATTYNNLAVVYRNMGDYPKAIEFFEKALAIVKKIKGPKHPHTAATYNNLAGVYQDMGDFPKALEFYQKSLDIKEKVLGPEHPDTAATYDNLAGVYRAMGDYPKALEFYQKALAIREKLLGPEHPDTATTYNNLAGVYYAMGDFPKALEFYQKALDIIEKVLGPEHPHTAATYNNLALVYRAMGDYPKALEFYQKALDIIEKVLGPEHPHTAATYNNLALVYQTMGDYPKALEFYQKALAIREKRLGPEHPDTATTCSNIGILYLYWQKPTEALPWLRRAQCVRENVLGPEHPYTKGTREALEFAEKLAVLEKEIGSDNLAELLQQSAEQADQ